MQFNEAEVIKLGTHICTALERCEQLNIVHRDIKPQNIFVSAFGDYKLGDFGIARVMDHATRATRVGTPTYIAPEVYNGAPSDNRGDIYCLGMVLYWLLNERRMPFLPLPPAMPTIAETEMANMRRLRGEPLPPPNNGSPALKAAVMKAISFNPADRFATAAEFKAALTARQTITTAVKNGEETIAINRSQVTNKNQNNRVVTNQSRANNQQAGQKQAPKRSKAWILVLVLTFLIIGAGVAAILLLSKDDGNTSKQPSQTVLVEDSNTAEPEDVLDFNPQLGYEDFTSSVPPSNDDFESVAVGDYITFGNYEQDNDLDNGKEPIEWLVLDKRDDKILVISKYALDCQPYNTSYTNVTWETCTLRQWLNDNFINNAFNSTAMQKITTTYIPNNANKYWGTDGGNNTYDKVFLLSMSEVEQHLSFISAGCLPTAYAMAQGGYDPTTNGVNPNGFWWLRSPGDRSDYAARVFGYGLIEKEGCPVDKASTAVRPALWINLES